MTTFFIVPGAPIAQPRIKATTFRKNGVTVARTYEPGKSDSPARQWKYGIQERFTAVANGWIPDPNAAFYVSIKCYLPRPKARYRKKDPDGPIPHIGRPDVDNLAKSILDALTSHAWKDDNQVACLQLEKWYHEKNGPPRAEITISTEAW